MRIAFIGFGEAGRAFSDGLLARGAQEIAMYDIKLGGPEAAEMIDAAKTRGVRVAYSPAAAVERADWVFSAVTAASSLQAADSVAPHLGGGQVLFDINSVSALRKQASAALIEDGGAGYVDMAVMAPVHPGLQATKTLLAGAAAPRAADTLRDLGFDFEIVSSNVGDAASVKMIRSLFVKGLEALVVQAWLAADAAGCSDRVTGSLLASYPGLKLDSLADYQFDRVMRHGERRAAEMRESAASLRELGYPAGGALADAIADVQQAIGGRDLPAPTTAADAIARLRET